METVALVAILLVLFGILAAVKSGFNEVVKGLEAIEEQVSGNRKV